VVSALKATLTGAPLSVAAHGTSNPEAYNAFLLGRQLFDQGGSSADGFRGAIEAYQRAISLDPRYADAYAGLALSNLYHADLTGDQALKGLANQAADKAIELGPGLAAAYETRGYLRYIDHFDWAGAESDFKHALALEPTNSKALLGYGQFLSDMGRHQDAVAMYRKAIELDPLSAAIWQNLGATLTNSREYPAAYDAFRHALALLPADPFNKFNLALLQLVDGKAQDALATAQGISADAFRLPSVAMAEHTLGNTKASQQALDQLIGTEAADAAYQIADVYAWRGETDKAFEWLERAYRQRDGGLAQLKTDPLFAALRTDPRFKAMLRKINVPE